MPPVGAVCISFCLLCKMACAVRCAPFQLATKYELAMDIQGAMLPSSAICCDTVASYLQCHISTMRHENPQ